MYPVQLYVQPPAGERDRLSVALRYFYALPAMLIASIFGIGAFFVTMVAWFAIVITGRYPPGLREFNVKYLRLVTRANAYYWCQTDVMPPFNGEPDDSYPVRVALAPPVEPDRVKVALRFIYLIPVMIVAYVMSLIGLLSAVITWFSVVLGGTVSEQTRELGVKALASLTRANAYWLLLTDVYPPAWEEQAPEAPGERIAATG